MVTKLKFLPLLYLSNDMTVTDECLLAVWLIWFCLIDVCPWRFFEYDDHKIIIFCKFSIFSSNYGIECFYKQSGANSVCREVCFVYLHLSNTIMEGNGVILCDNLVKWLKTLDLKAKHENPSGNYHSSSSSLQSQDVNSL